MFKENGLDHEDNQVVRNHGQMTQTELPHLYNKINFYVNFWQNTQWW